MFTVGLLTIERNLTMKIRGIKTIEELEKEKNAEWEKLHGQSS